MIESQTHVLFTLLTANITFITVLVRQFKPPPPSSAPSPAPWLLYPRVAPLIRPVFRGPRRVALHNGSHGLRYVAGVSVPPDGVVADSLYFFIIVISTDLLPWWATEGRRKGGFFKGLGSADRNVDML